MKTFYALFILLLLSAPLSQAQNLDRNFGIGAILGEPTGVSIGYWTSNDRSFSGAAAWSFGGEESMHLHLDYLFHNFGIINVNSGSMPLYFGLGGKVKLQDDANVGLRIPLGVAYHFENEPVELFLEIVPILDLVPDTDFEGNSGIGIRYYF